MQILTIARNQKIKSIQQKIQQQKIQQQKLQIQRQLQKQRQRQMIQHKSSLVFLRNQKKSQNRNLKSKYFQKKNCNSL